MRQFIVVSHEAPITGEFSLDDLPGAGRMDLLARTVIASLLRSHGIRADTRCNLVIGDSLTVRFDGQHLTGLHPDERSTAARIRTALEEQEEAVGLIPVEISPGISLLRSGLDRTLSEIEGSIIQLTERGTPATAMDIPEDPVFVLSDHTDFTKEEQELLEDQNELSLGPEAVHTDQAITLAHNWIDTAGFQHFS